MTTKCCRPAIAAIVLQSCSWKYRA